MRVRMEDQKRESIIEVHHRLGIESVSDAFEGKTDREDGLILPTLRQIERPPRPVCMNLSSYKKDASS